MVLPLFSLPIHTAYRICTIEAGKGKRCGDHAREATHHGGAFRSAEAAVL